MRAQEIREYQQHIPFARKRECGNKAQTNPANLEYVPLTTVTPVISSRSFRNCKEEHMVNKTAWQRRIHFSASLWPSANTWQDEIPRDICSDNSPLLHSVWWTGPAELYQELGGAERLVFFWQGWAVTAAQPLCTTFPVLPSLEQGMFPIPFMHPFHQLCSLSRSASGHVPTWAGLHTKLSPALPGLHTAAVHLPQCLQELQVGTKPSQVGFAPPRAHCWGLLWGQTTPQKCHCCFTGLFSSSCTPAEIPLLNQRAWN